MYRPEPSRDIITINGAAFDRCEEAAASLLLEQDITGIHYFSRFDARTLRFARPVKIISFDELYAASGSGASDFIRLSSKADGCTIIGGGACFICYNSKRSPRRINFTVAHEIGHIVLGHTGRAEVEKAEEAEADRFAAALLMPAAAVRYLARYWGVRRAGQICGWFNVSRAAAARRIAELSRRGPSLMGISERTLLMRLFGSFCRPVCAGDFSDAYYNGGN